MVSSDAGDLARALERDSQAALASLTRDLEAWNLGFDRLRQLSHARLRSIWGEPRVSQSELGQDAAGEMVLVGYEGNLYKVELGSSKWE